VSGSQLEDYLKPFIGWFLNFIDDGLMIRNRWFAILVLGCTDSGLFESVYR
jgi:hypothetical protein